MRDARTAKRRDLKKRIVEELKVYWIIVFYLWLLLGMFTVYRRLVMAESGVTYLHYGIALIEAMVIAKVVLIGRIFGFTRRFEDRALLVPALYKSVIFGALVFVFGLLEHIVVGWFHGLGLFGGLREIASIGWDELASRVLMLTVTFIPFFAFWELGRLVGMEALMKMFFVTPRRPPVPDRKTY